MTIRPRRLSAILHADIEGYVRLMEGGNERTVDRLQAVRAEIWRPSIEAGGGSVVNIEGDSVLAEFGAAGAALAAAIDIQERMALFNGAIEADQRLMFRIGLHLGEVIVDEATRSLFGDGVNIAARVQALGEPGGIAVSRALCEAASAPCEFKFIHGGEHSAKNVTRPLSIYHIRRRSGASIPAAVDLGRPASRASRRSLASANRGRSNARLIMRGPVSWGVAAGVAILLVGGGYLVYRANAPATVSAVALSLSAEQLEQALAERRKADALTLEKRQLEAEARRKAAIGAEAKRQAEAELERTRQARQKAEDDLARLKADIEGRRRAGKSEWEQSEVEQRRVVEEAAQRHAEREAAGLRQAEEEAKKKAEADAEAERQADEALASAESARQHAEQEARRKAEVEQSALRWVSAGAASAALARQNEMSEVAEKELRLDQAARTRLQVALTSLGFDTRGSDGVFGPRTRDMIAAWQKARGLATTGFLTAPQRQALLKDGAEALTRYDEQERAEEARTRAAVPVSLSPAPSEQLAPPPPAGTDSPMTRAAGLVASPLPASASRAVAVYDGSYIGRANLSFHPAGATSQILGSLQVLGTHGAGALEAPGCQQSPFVVSVSPTGAVSGEMYFNCAVAAGSNTISAGDFKISGRYHGREIQLDFRSARSTFIMPLTATSAASVAALQHWGARSPRSDEGTSDARYDGTYSGPVGYGNPSFRADLTLRLANGRGFVTLTSAGCNPSQFVVAVSSIGAVSGEGQMNCILGSIWPAAASGSVSAGLYKIDGEHHGKEIRLTFRSNRNVFSVVLK